MIGLVRNRTFATPKKIKKTIITINAINVFKNNLTTQDIGAKQVVANNTKVEKSTNSSA